MGNEQQETKVVCRIGKRVVKIMCLTRLPRRRVNPSLVLGERDYIGVVSHISALYKLRDVRVNQTHVKTLRTERVDPWDLHTVEE